MRTTIEGCERCSSAKLASTQKDLEAAGQGRQTWASNADAVSISATNYQALAVDLRTEYVYKE